MPADFLQKQDKGSGPGLFPKGRSGNPAGRRPGCRNSATLAAEGLLDRRLAKLEQDLRPATRIPYAWADGPTESAEKAVARSFPKGVPPGTRLSRHSPVLAGQDSIDGYCSTRSTSPRTRSLGSSLRRIASAPSLRAMSSTSMS